MHLVSLTYLFHDSSYIKRQTVMGDIHSLNLPVYYNIVQPLVCKKVTMLPSIIFARRGISVKMLITLEPHGVF